MKLQFSTDSAAFHDEYADSISNAIYKEQEIVRILHKVIRDIEVNRMDSGSIMDINGNKIGRWEI